MTDRMPVEWPPHTSTWMAFPPPNETFGDAVPVARLDLDQWRDRLTLFPFLGTRRPDAYQPLVESR
jgi:hypothetical protein